MDVIDGKCYKPVCTWVLTHRLCFVFIGKYWLYMKPLEVCHVITQITIFCSGISAKPRGLLYPLMRYVCEAMTWCTVPCDKCTVVCLCVWAGCSQNGRHVHKMFGCFTKVKGTWRGMRDPCATRHRFCLSFTPSMGHIWLKKQWNCTNSARQQLCPVNPPACPASFFTNYSRRCHNSQTLRDFKYIPIKTRDQISKGDRITMSSLFFLSKDALSSKTTMCINDIVNMCACSQAAMCVIREAASLAGIILSIICNFLFLSLLPSL